MMPLPNALGGAEIRLWRIDHKRHAATWDSGEGAFLSPGRWNPKGFRMVYASLDPSTAILEVAVHKKFKVLDTEPHVLSSARIKNPSSVYVVQPSALPNPAWAMPGAHGPGQREFGKNLLTQYAFVVVPSSVSLKSWNILFTPDKAKGLYDDVQQERFCLDPRLHVDT
jgi:RES domain-containing protein